MFFAKGTVQEARMSYTNLPGFLKQKHVIQKLSNYVQYSYVLISMTIWS